VNGDATVGGDARVLQRLRSSDDARVRLVCIPYAGGASRIFQRWAELLPAGVDLWAVEAPGRGSRIREPPFETIGAVVDEVLAALEPELALPVAVFGHSMGALIGFELVRALRRHDLPQPVELFVSGHQAPQLPPTEPSTRDLSDADFVERLRRLGGTPEVALEHPELMNVFLPLLRADFAAVERYEYRTEAPVACGISAFGGRSDQLVRREQLEAWRVHTVGRFAVHLLAGGHFFLQHSAPTLLASITERLDHLLAL
jgi:medium-chain acyl-[acyl-carrier-protein] hydrolase